MKSLPQTKEYKFERNIPEFKEILLADPEFNKSSIKNTVIIGH